MWQQEGECSKVIQDIMPTRNNHFLENRPRGRVQSPLPSSWSARTKKRPLIYFILHKSWAQKNNLRPVNTGIEGTSRLGSTTYTRMYQLHLVDAETRRAGWVVIHQQDQTQGLHRDFPLKIWSFAGHIMRANCIVHIVSASPKAGNKCVIILWLINMREPFSFID